jgi:CO/xanthine dehydrogenase Mo-binding subunit
MTVLTLGDQARPTIAHAEIVSIDTAAALAADGCVAVFTAADLTDVPAAQAMMPMYPDAMGQPLLGCAGGGSALDRRCCRLRR